MCFLNVGAQSLAFPNNRAQRQPAPERQRNSASAIKLDGFIFRVRSDLSKYPMCRYPKIFFIQFHADESNHAATLRRHRCVADPKKWIEHRQLCAAPM